MQSIPPTTANKQTATSIPPLSSLTGHWGRPPSWQMGPGGLCGAALRQVRSGQGACSQEKLGSRPWPALAAGCIEGEKEVATVSSIPSLLLLTLPSMVCCMATPRITSMVCCMATPYHRKTLIPSTTSTIQVLRVPYLTWCCPGSCTVQRSHGPSQREIIVQHASADCSHLFLLTLVPHVTRRISAEPCTPCHMSGPCTPCHT